MPGSAASAPLKPLRLWDISPPIGPGSPVFPGDTAAHLAWVARRGAEGPVNVCALTLSPHTGAHADAPLHYDNDGAPIDAVDLAPYLGRCRVVHVFGPLAGGPCVLPQHLPHAQADWPPRVLLRCYARMPQQRFDAALPGLAPELVDWLAARGVKLVGTDSASVDPADSKHLPAHAALRVRGLRVLENLLLDDVPEGDYELIALPLKLSGACASPVRAVLRELP